MLNRRVVLGLVALASFISACGSDLIPPNETPVGFPTFTITTSPASDPTRTTTNATLPPASPMIGNPLPPTATSGTHGGFVTHTGEDAKEFKLQGDFRKLWEEQDPKFGLTLTRYQQYIDGYKVLGGQVTIWTNEDGEQTAVIGAYYPDRKPRGDIRVTQAQAEQIADEAAEVRGEWKTALSLDPEKSILFYELENKGPGARWTVWVDAQTGDVLYKFDGVQTGAP